MVEILEFFKFSPEKQKTRRMAGFLVSSAA
jgi:hypothetical protein